MKNNQRSFSSQPGERGPELPTIDLSTLEAYLWEAANILQGPIRSDY